MSTLHSIRSAHQFKFFISIISAVFCLTLSACSSSSSSGSSGTTTTTSTTTTPVTFTAAATSVQKNMTEESPHFNSSSVVTAMNFKSYLRNFFPKKMSFFNEAIAADLGLSVIWDPENGSPPLSSDFSVANLYNGGGFSQVGTSNDCSNGTLTIPCNESLKNYMGQALDPKFQNSNTASVTIFGRLNDVMVSICAISNLVPAAQIDTDGLPVIGTLNITFPSDTTNIVYQSVASGGCNVSSGNAGQTLPITITAVSSATYTKLLSIAPLNVNVWLKLDTTSGTLNVMSIEDQRPNGRYAADRAIAQLTGINTPGSGTTAFEFISIGSNVSSSDSCYLSGKWQCDFEMHRVYIDESANAAYLISNIGSPGDSSGATTTVAYNMLYTAVAQPSDLKACSTGGTCSGVMAFSVSGNTSTIVPADEYDGCINLVDRSLASSGSLTCSGSVTGVSVLANAAAMINSTRLAFVTDVIATLLDGTNANTALAFNSAATIYVTPDSN